MFKHAFQSGFLSIFYAVGGRPLKIWCTKAENGHLKRVTDCELKAVVLEIIGPNVSTTYIACPTCPYKSLGIRLPFLVLIVKNLNRYFTFEVEILDDTNIRRRFRASNFQSVTKVRPFNCTMPLRMDEGWNQILFNLPDFTNRAYQTRFVEAVRVQIHANCRLRRVYFCESKDSIIPIKENYKVYFLNSTGLKQDELNAYK